MRISRIVWISTVCIIGMAIGFLVWYLAFQSTLDLKRQAAQAIVAWAFENKPIPGFVEDAYEGRYVGSDRIRQTKQWYVDCDFLPQHVSLSDDPRLTRVSKEDASEIFRLERESVGSDDSSFLVMRLRSVSRNRIELSVVISYAEGAEGALYDFVFTVVDGQLSGVGNHVGGPPLCHNK